MLANIRHSPASPLYFLLLKLWVLVWGDSTVALRSFSLLVSLPLLPLVYVLGRQTVGRADRLVAALLLALSPLQLYFAQEARVYMLATLLSALATVGYLGWRADAERRLVGAWDGPRRHGWLWLYGASAAASLYTLPLVALLYLGLAVDALLVMARERSVTLVGRPPRRLWFVGDRAGRRGACVLAPVPRDRYRHRGEQSGVAWPHGRDRRDEGFSRIFFIVYSWPLLLPVGSSPGDR